MFKSLRLQNFKSYKDSGQVPLAPLTVIVGLNNSGKSTLLHSILALKQTAADASQRPALVTLGNYVNLGGFYDILHGQKEAEEKSFSIELVRDKVEKLRLESKTDPIGVRELPIADELHVTFSLGAEGKEIEVERGVFRLDNKVLIDAARDGSWKSEKYPPDSYFNANFKAFLPTLQFAPREDKLAQLPSSAEFWEQLSFVSVHSLLWTQLFTDGVHQVSPLRTRVPWSAGLGTRTSSEFGLGGANLIAALGSDQKIQGSTKTLVDLVNEWLSTREVLRSLSVRTDASGRVLLADEMRGLANINVAGMGEGISQVLPIIARSLAVRRDQLLLVEQPEIHLHPAFQADLADLFIEIAGSNNRQVVVETHSEHLVLRLRRRIAEGKVKPDEVSILYVEKPGEESKVRKLDLNGRGQFEDWPSGFFEESYREAMALAMASPQ